MRKLSFLLFLILFISCNNTNLDNTPTSESSPTSTEQATTSTTVEDDLIVKALEDLPEALVRIVVKSTKAELNEELDIDIYEYEGTGSGFFISDDGYILTNNHVISGAVTIEVFTQYRTQPYAGKIIGVSECDDIAILKIDIEENRYLNLIEDEPILGQEILAAGFPLGDSEVTFLDGIVSKKQTDGSTSWASIEYAFEHTAEILPGSSGGPIVNEDVEVIGIAYAGNEDRQEFGIPIKVVIKKINQIINSNFQYSFKANLEQFFGAGIYIYSVDSNSPLRSVGLKGGELISEINGLSVVDETTLKVYCNAIYAKNPDVGINFTGISLDKLEEFDIEVSIDGTLALENKRISITTTTQQVTTTSTTTTTLPPKPFFSTKTLKVYEESFGRGGRVSKWKKDNITIGIYGTPSSTQERIVKDTTLLFNDLIEGKNIYITNSENADIKFYFGPVTSWENFDDICKIAQINFNKVYSIGAMRSSISGGTSEAVRCMLPEEQFDNYSNYGICSDAVSGCAIHKIRQAFWEIFTGLNEGRADMNTYGWGYCTGYQTYGSIVLDRDGETYYGDGGPILPCSGCCNCNTPQYSDLDKEIIRLHNHPYVANATTIEQVVALLRP